MSTRQLQIPFFHLLDAEQRQEVGQYTRSFRLRKAQVIIEHGASSSDVYFLIEGELRVLVYSPDGREVSVRTLRAGQMTGELAALDELPRSATVIAVVPSMVTAIAAKDFRAFLDASPRAALWLAQELASQIRVLTDKVFELSALNVKNRLHCELLRLALISGVFNNTAVLKPAPTHAELANRLGTHREAITRELRELAKRELVRQGNRELEILNVQQLSRIVQRLSGRAAGIHPAPRRTATSTELIREMTAATV